MSQGSAAWQPLLIAATLALLTLWLNHATTFTDITDKGGFSHTPDYYIDNFNATAFDAQGAPLHVLRARHMVHFMDDDTTELTAPEYEQRRPGKPGVQVRALRGVVSSNGDHVHFLDQVRLRRDADAGQVLEVHTDYLHITPDAELMQTNKPVAITQGKSSMTAAGFHADGQKRLMTFKGRVKGTYHVSR